MRTVGSAVILLLAIAITAGAVTPKRWTVRTQKEWLEGRAEGLRIGAVGEVTLAPSLRHQIALEESIVWSVAEADDGSIWIGTGSNGRLLRIDRDGEIVQEAEFEELQVTALLSDGDAVWAATAPNGAIYRVRAGQPYEEIARPPAQYIWALQRGRDGIIYAATGVAGQIFAIERGGETRVFFDAPDTHVTSLVARADGSLVAGTAERGLVIEIDRDGRGRVLYDSEFREVRALAFAGDGSVYAAVNGGQSYRDSQAQHQPPSEVSISVSAGDGGQQQNQPAGNALTLAPPETLGDASAEVVRISSGPVDAVIRTRGELVHDIDVADDGELFVATSKRLLVPDAGEATAVVSLQEEGQVSALGRWRGRLVVGTTAPTKIYGLGDGAHRNGTYTSKVEGAGSRARWGEIDWRVDRADGTSVEIETRSGGSREPDSTWSDWSQPLSAPGPIASPAARFLQWRARLATDRASVSPRLSEISVAYLPENRRPEVKKFEVHPHGVVYQSVVGGSDVLEVLPPPLPSMFPELGPPTAEPAAGGKRLYRRGARTVTWSVADPNGDETRVRLWVRSHAGGPELLLTERPRGVSHTFDTGVLPDGWYSARIEVDDAPSNASSLALTASRDSDPFLIDNSSPQVTVAASEVRRGRGTVRFVVEDEHSPLWKAEWSLDGRPFEPLVPIDGITDSRREGFVIETDELDSGEHLVVLRVFDLANQPAAAGAVLEVR